MNLNDLVTETNKDDFLIGFAHIKVFNNYYECLVITYIELAIAVNKSPKVPQSLLNGKINIHKYEYGEIIHQPMRVVFRGKNKNGRMTKFFFQYVIWRGIRTLNIQIFLFKSITAREMKKKTR